jgi:hypothetical protein
MAPDPPGNLRKDDTIHLVVGSAEEKLFRITEPHPQQPHLAQRVPTSPLDDKDPSSVPATESPKSTTTTTAMKIVILSMDRFDALQRFIESLKQSDFLGDKVDLVIRFDNPRKERKGEQDWRTQVETFQATLTWAAGDVSYSIAAENMGRRQAWLSACHPASTEERVILFEDDASVSPLWYRWLKGA